jgi:hypothetical protein
VQIPQNVKNAKMREMKQDFVAQYPDQIANLPDMPMDLEYEKGYICTWNNRYFIHTRSTLPLSDHENGIGFGLWVEVSHEDFEKYLAAEANEQAYEQFECEGRLANEWPGFLDTFGMNVKVSTVNKDEKVYITDVFVDEQTDPLLTPALSYPTADENFIQSTLKLIDAWSKDKNR